MKSYRGTRERLKPPSRLWIVLIVLLFLGGIGFLGLFAYDWMQYQKGEQYYTALQDTALPQGGDATLYRVVYGHNMHTGAMFGQLTEYESEAFWQQHPTFTLCTPAGDRTCRIFSCHTAVDGEELYHTNREAGAEYDAFLQQLKAASLYDTGVDVPGGSQVLTLSTCATSYGSGPDRFVVHAVIEP